MLRDAGRRGPSATTLENNDKIIFSLHSCISWGIHQARKGYLTLRISRKNNKNKPMHAFSVCQYYS